MKNFLLIILIILPNYLSAKSKCSEKLCLDLNIVNKSLNIVIQNNYPHQISLQLNLEPNDVVDLTSPQNLIIKASSTKKLKLSLYNINKLTELQASYKWMFGNYEATNTYIYHLPYAQNKSYLVGQGNNGEFTHKDKHKYAIDWNMDIGSNIHAARSGFVVKLENNYKESGNSEEFLEKSNYIKILHDDGTSATYAHIKFNGTLVKINERVSQGELIAYSGNTGYSSGPHLHFHVSKPKITKNNIIEETILVEFQNCQAKKIIPETGKKYPNC